MLRLYLPSWGQTAALTADSSFFKNIRNWRQPRCSFHLGSSCYSQSLLSGQKHFYTGFSTRMKLTRKNQQSSIFRQAQTTYLHCEWAPILLTSSFSSKRKGLTHTSDTLLFPETTCWQILKGKSFIFSRSYLPKSSLRFCWAPQHQGLRKKIRKNSSAKKTLYQTQFRCSQRKRYMIGNETVCRTYLWRWQLPPANCVPNSAPLSNDHQESKEKSSSGDFFFPLL